MSSVISSLPAEQQQIDASASKDQSEIGKLQQHVLVRNINAKTISDSTSSIAMKPPIAATAAAPSAAAATVVADSTGQLVAEDPKTVMDNNSSKKTKGWQYATMHKSSSLCVSNTDKSFVYSGKAFIQQLTAPEGHPDISHILYYRFEEGEGSSIRPVVCAITGKSEEYIKRLNATVFSNCAAIAGTNLWFSFYSKEWELRNLELVNLHNYLISLAAIDPSYSVPNCSYFHRPMDILVNIMVYLDQPYFSMLQKYPPKPPAAIFYSSAAAAAATATPVPTSLPPKSEPQSAAPAVVKPK